MIESLVLAIVVAVVVGFLLAVVLPELLKILKAEIAVRMAGIFASWGWALGVAAGIWFFFTGGHFDIGRR